MLVQPSVSLLQQRFPCLSVWWEHSVGIEVATTCSITLAGIVLTVAVPSALGGIVRPDFHKKR